MSNLNRNQFKKLLTEWCSNFLNENRIIPLAELAGIIHAKEQILKRCRSIYTILELKTIQHKNIFYQSFLQECC